MVRATESVHGGYPPARPERLSMPVTPLLNAKGTTADHHLSPVYIAGGAPQPPVPLQFKASNITVRFVLVYDMPEMAKDAAVQEITPLLEGRKLRHLSGPHFPLESARQAHQAVEGGAIGKVVLEVTKAP